MKRCTVVVVLILACALSGEAADLECSLAAGITSQVGVVFNGAFDPGLSGLGLEILGRVTWESLQGEFGIESGASPIGWQVLFPFRAGFRWGTGSVHGTVLLEAAPGFSFTRPLLFMAGLGGIGRLEWDLSSHFGLYAGAGVRYTFCPSYQQFTAASYQSLDIPITAGARLRLAP